MKVTIISNGQQQLVLKPETEMEILAVKEFHKAKQVNAVHHEKLQLLGDPFPNALVISIEPETKDRETHPETRTSTGTSTVLVEIHSSIAIATFLYKTPSREDMLYAIERYYNCLHCEIVKEVGSDKDHMFEVALTSDEKDGPDDLKVFRLFLVDVF